MPLRMDQYADDPVQPHILLPFDDAFRNINLLLHFCRNSTLITGQSHYIPASSGDQRENNMIDFNKLAEAMGDLDEDVMVETLEQVMAEGGADAQKAMEACQKGMDTVGSLFEEGEYFVGDLIYAGELMTKAVEILKDALITDGGEDTVKARMILC